MKHKTKLSKVFLENTDTFFVSTDDHCHELIVKVGDDYFLLTDDFQIKELKIIPNDEENDSYPSDYTDQLPSDYNYYRQS